MSRKPNFKIISFSILAIGFLVVLFVTNEWLFIIGAVVFMILNQREIMKKSGKVSGKSSPEDSGEDSS